MSNLITGLFVAAQPANLLYCFSGVLLGTMVGVLPGLGPAAALTLILPLTLHVPPLSAVIMLCGVLYGTQYGGSTTSILVNIPGEPSSVATCLDGYAMARKGRAGPALGMAAFASFIAGTICIFGMIFMASFLAEFALRFGPPEYFALMIFGLTIVVYLARGSMSKALIMVCLGLILAGVGIDPISGRERFTYEILALADGVGLAQVVIGLFGVSEVLLNVERSLGREVFEAKIKGLLPTMRDWKRSIFPILRSSTLGFFMAIIPGISIAIPTFVSYALERKISKRPEEFGAGAIEGVAAPEAANNAAQVGTLIPTLSLGIPTGATTAILLGALMIYGLNPGPMLIKESPQVFWGLVGSMYIGNVMLLILNVPLIGIWVKMLKIPYSILFSLILLFCLIGSYSINNSLEDMIIMIGAGLAGYLMKKFDYEAPPLVLALVVGPMMERAMRRSMIMSKGSFLIFFQRPISVIFIGLALFVVLSQFFTRKRLGERLEMEKAEA